VDGRHAQVMGSRQERCDVLLAPFEGELQAAAAARVGERVLDVGCRSGTTTVILARVVGPGGSVTGFDGDPQMLDATRDLVARAGLSNVILQHGDAQDVRFAGGPFDLVVSRFGVAAFPDPVAAFRNLARALRPDGRLVFTCFQRPLDNPWVAEPVQVLRRVLRGWDDPTSLPGIEAFSLSDPALVRSILDAAGFVDICIEGAQMPLVLGGLDGVDGAVDHVAALHGPRAMLSSAEPSQRAGALDAVRELLSRHQQGAVVRLAGAAWVVTARAGRHGA
jgi:SAM-dependent methyltransferase